MAECGGIRVQVSYRYRRSREEVICGGVCAREVRCLELGSRTKDCREDGCSVP